MSFLTPLFDSSWPFSSSSSGWGNQGQHQHQHQHRNRQTNDLMMPFNQQSSTDLTPFSSGLYDFNRLLNEPMSLNLVEEDNRFTLEVTPTAGLKKEDLKVDINEGMLNITGQRQSDDVVEDDHGSRRTSRSIKFNRSVKLPSNVNMKGIRAKFINDRLNIEIPKLQSGKLSQGQQIPIEDENEKKTNVSKPSQSS